MQALLELDCMPAGMELFPAANDDQWTWIKKIIDESDYYIVIIGGRYGSVSEATGLSFTEMEYRYAIDRGKPVIGFLHEDPPSLPSKASEQDPKTKEKLEAFSRLVKSKLCRFWSSPSDLGAKVSRSVTQLLKQYPAVGWVRADRVSNLTSSDEVLGLRRRVDELEAECDRLRSSADAPAGSLACGSDRYPLVVVYKRKQQQDKNGRKTWVAAGQGELAVEVSWDDVIRYLMPNMIAGVSGWEMDQLLSRMAYYYSYAPMEEAHPAERFEEVHISGESRRTVLVHLRALKLIDVTEGGRGWQLTEQGDRYMTKLLAVPKPAAPNSSPRKPNPKRKPKREDTR